MENTELSQEKPLRILVDQSFVRRALHVLAAAFGIVSVLVITPASAQTISYSKLQQSPCYPAGSITDEEGQPIKTRVQVCLEAIERASPGEHAVLLDAAMSGLKIMATNGFQELRIDTLEGPARLKGQTIRLGELSLKPDDEGFRRVREILDKTGAADDSIAQAYALRVYSEMLSRLGRFDEIKDVVDTLKSLPIAARPHVQQTILSRQRMIARGRGDTLGALENAEALISLYEQHSEPLLAGLVNFDIGGVLLDLGDYDAALARYRVAQRSLEEARRTDRPNYGIVRFAIGMVYTLAGDHEKALDEYEVANTVLGKIDEKQPARTTYSWMAKSLDAVGQKDRALELAWEAVRLGSNQRDALDTAENLVWIAARELKRGDTSSATEALTRAASLTSIDESTDLQTAFEGKDRYFAVAYARSMAGLMAQMGDTAEAYRYAQYALDMHSDWLEAEKIQAAVDAQTLFEIRNKDQAIQLLESQQSLQQAKFDLQSAALEKQRIFSITGLMGAAALALFAGLAFFGWRNSRRLAAMRATMVSEEHHRTKNALHMASCLVRAETPANLSHRLMTMGLVYDHLHTIHETSELKAEPFLSELTDSLMEALAPSDVQTHLHCEPDTLTADAATPLGLLVCEMVINSLKHAFPDGKGRIEITLSGDQGARTLEIKDDGVGDKVSTPPRKGKGTQLIDDLAGQLGAKATMVQTPGGTSWRVLPLSI